MNNEMKPHRHKALIDQWSACPEWWDVYYQETEINSWQPTHIPVWDSKTIYKLEKSAKHPDNIKPKKKLIDWSRMPVGTITNYGELRKHVKNQILFMTDAPNYCYTFPADGRIRLAEQTQFTYWGGGECPVPEGVIVEVVIRRDEKLEDVATSFIWYRDINRNNEIIAYRITGLADGWTDNPEGAV